MRISQTLSMIELEATAAGTQIASPDSRAADAWIKRYLSDKNKRLIDLRRSMNQLLGPERGELRAAMRVDKINWWEQGPPEKVANGGNWAVTDQEGIIISTWPTKEEADRAAYNLYEGIVPSASMGNKVKKLSAGGPGSGCKGDNCGRPSTRDSRCYACGKKLGRNPALAVNSDGQPQSVGTECYKKIGKNGWQPPNGGPKLYKGHFGPGRELVGVDGLLGWEKLGEVHEWNRRMKDK